MSEKLTPTQRGELLRRARAGASSRELAAEFGVSQSTASKIVRQSLPPDPKLVAAAKLQAIMDDESLPDKMRVQAAEALKASLEPQAAPDTSVRPKPLHVPNPSASSLDGVPNLFEGCVEKPKPAPTPKPAPPTREQLLERANDQMRRAVESGNVAAINRLTEIFRAQGLYAPETAAPVLSKPAVPMSPPDPAWIGRRLLLLDCALLRGDVNTADELRAELDSHGIDYAGKPKPEVPAPERAAAPLLHFDEAGMALQARRVKPAAGRVVDWEQYRDQF